MHKMVKFRLKSYVFKASPTVENGVLLPAMSAYQRNIVTQNYKKLYFWGELFLNS